MQEKKTCFHEGQGVYNMVNNMIYFSLLSIVKSSICAIKIETHQSNNSRYVIKDEDQLDSILYVYKQFIYDELFEKCKNLVLAPSVRSLTAFLSFLH